MKSKAFPIALGGILAALAVIVMAMGTMFPAATYVCPVVCIMVQELVRRQCGRKIAWAWYGAVSILGLLLSPDKEAAAVFLFLGYYPMVKPLIDQFRLKWLLKIVFFNAAIGIMYVLLLYVLGMDQIMAEFAEMGLILGGVTLLMGNATFLILDSLLERRFRRRHGR